MEQSPFILVLLSTSKLEVSLLFWRFWLTLWRSCFVLNEETYFKYWPFAGLSSNKFCMRPKDRFATPSVLSSTVKENKTAYGRAAEVRKKDFFPIILAKLRTLKINFFPTCSCRSEKPSRTSWNSFCFKNCSDLLVLSYLC